MTNAFRPRRLTARDRDEIESLILADLVDNGPSVFSAIQWRLQHHMAEHLTTAGLRTLVGAGRVTFEMKEFSHVRLVNGIECQYPYVAREYSATKQGESSSCQMIMPRSRSPKTLEATLSRYEARRALVLADVVANGPCRFREIVDRLRGKVEENSVRRALHSLVETGFLQVEVQWLEEPFPHGIGRRSSRFRANIYSLPNEDNTMNSFKL
ncbi:hypothetical protein [Singulisphaera sp. PoT]|uniref:hypothetical protein n=1 Tax=Singulisphaera sp. PoT TaxID=3411797 RepID=UPI003BF47D53